MSPALPKRKVLLIGWDAADWEHINPLIEQDMLPTLGQLIEEGVMGNLATLQPVLSPMLWNSIATGKHAYKHGIHGFIEPDRHNGGARPYSSYSRKARALWNILTHEGLRSNVINWWASHPAEPINGCIVTNAFGGFGFDSSGQFAVARGAVHPADAERIALLSRCRMFPREVTGDMLLPFAPKAAEVNQDEDPRLESLAKLLSECVTTQALATTVMETEPWDFMAVYFTGIDHFCHGFMAYHPPRMKNVSEEDFEIFKDVVTGAYRFHDLILARLLHLAGPDTTVILCSDHGFQSRELRPLGTPREPTGPAVWHRRFGAFVAKGPGIKKDERIYGASLVDIAPTILTLFGLPVGDDMDGRSLVEIFEEPPEVRRIPSWEEVPGEFGQHQVEQPLSGEEASELMRQFVALGYIDDPGDNKEKQAEDAEIEAKDNLARNLQWLKKTDQAIPLFEEIVRRASWESRFITQLASAYLDAGYLRQTVRLLESAFDIPRTIDINARLTWAIAQIELGNLEAGLAILLMIEKNPQARIPAIHNRIADVYLKLGRLQEAERFYRQAIDIHPENAEAYLGLSTLYRRRGMNQETIDAAMTALGLLYRLPMAHLNLGIALARSGDADRAVTALTMALKFGPGMANAHRWLAVIYRTLRDDPIKHAYHQAEFLRLRGLATQDKQDAGTRRDAVWDLPELPSERERTERLFKERPDLVNPRKKSGKTFVLVSGLPRSGTSLMMQMLEAGGLPPKTDGQRQADADNPRGYYEWEAIKRLGKEPKILDEPGLEGRAIKIVSMLLAQLPTNHEYKILFMTRPVEEVVKSQAAMIERLKTEGAAMDEEHLERGLAAHRDTVLMRLKTHPRATFIEIDYPSLVQSPDEPIARIAEFLGPERLPHPERMRAVIDDSLYRKRMAGRS